MKNLTIQLGELVTIAGGGMPSRDHPEYYDGDIPWITVKDFSDAFFIRSSQERISKLALKKSAARLIPAGNVILGTRMSVGKAAINLVDAAINQDLKALFCCPKLEPRYLTFFLTTSAPGLEAQASGATVKGITIDDIETLEIPLPSLSEQHRIAGILEQTDRLRRTHRYAMELSDTFLPATYLDLFGESNPEASSWRRVELVKLCAREDDIRCGPFGTQLNRSEFQTSGVPLWGIKHVNAEFALRTEDFITRAKSLELDEYSLLPGDLVMTRKGTVGNCALYPEYFPPGIMHSDLLRIRLKHGTCYPVFLKHQLHNSAEVCRQMELISGGAIMAGINVGMLKSVRVQLPPHSLQARFVTLVDRHDRLRAVQREALRQAEHLFQSLLHSAFTTGL